MAVGLREVFMCAINPVHQTTIVFKVYTSERICREDFDKAVLESALEVEILLNGTTRQHWHVSEDPTEKLLKIIHNQRNRIKNLKRDVYYAR